MSTSRALAAPATGAALFRELEPVILAAPEESFDRLVILLQPHEPQAIRVVLTADEKHAAQVLVQGPLRVLPNAKRILEAAEAVLAAVLAGQGPEAAERACATAAAQHGRGGFVLVVDPSAGSVEVRLTTAEDEDLGNSLLLGGLTSAPGTFH